MIANKRHIDHGKPTGEGAASSSAIQEGLKRAYGEEIATHVPIKIVPCMTDPEDEQFIQSLRIALLSLRYEWSGTYDLSEHAMRHCKDLHALADQYTIEVNDLIELIRVHLAHTKNEYGYYAISQKDIESAGDFCYGILCPIH